MKTLLYNTETETVGKIREGRYIVDGKTGVYPSNYVELVLYEPPNPQFDSSTQKLEFSAYYADIPNLLWTRDKIVIDKTAEEIAEQEAEYQKGLKEAGFSRAIQDGYTDPDTSITLGINDNDRIMWNQFLTLINSQLELAQIQTSSNVTVLDINNVAHQVTVAQAKTMISNLGMYYYNLWVNKNT